MTRHNIETCISLAEALPRDRDNYRVLDELLIELRTLAKQTESKP